MTYGPSLREQPPYMVSSHVHVCCSNRHLVFLDVRNDQYLCLDQEKTATVGQFLKGWSGSLHNAPTYSNAVHAVGQEVLDALAARRLVTRDVSRGHDATLSAILNPTRSLLDEDDFAQTMGSGSKLTFMAACSKAALILRWNALEANVLRIRKRREQRQHRQRSGKAPNAVALVHEFVTMRPFYPRPYLCMFDSLALIEYLAAYNYFPKWVFAVKMDPFGAHCWVQDETVVLNDSVERVRDFTPIMAV